MLARIVETYFREAITFDLYISVPLPRFSPSAVL